MRYSIVGSTIIAVAITVTGCTLFTGPKSQLVSLSVTPDTIVAGERVASDVTWVQFTVPVSVYNGSSATLTFDVCLASVIAANGAVAWAPICTTSTSALPTIAPGTTNTFQVPVMAAVNGPGGPKWGSQTVDGTYRLRLALGAEANYVSNQFAVSVLTTSAAAVNSARSRAAERLLPSAFAGDEPSPGAASRR
jgi:hypothetical protein